MKEFGDPNLNNGRNVVVDNVFTAGNMAEAFVAPQVTAELVKAEYTAKLEAN